MTCIHSYTHPDCLSCHKGVIERQDAHIERLRQMLTDAGATRALSEHDAHWFGGNAQPVPVSRPPAPVSTLELPVTMAAPVYNDQGFSVGFRITHPPGVECVFPLPSNQCSCGKTLAEVIESDDASL